MMFVCFSLTIGAILVAGFSFGYGIPPLWTVDHSENIHANVTNSTCTENRCEMGLSSKVCWECYIIVQYEFKNKIHTWTTTDNGLDNPITIGDIIHITVTSDGDVIGETENLRKLGIFLVILGSFMSIGIIGCVSCMILEWRNNRRIYAMPISIPLMNSNQFKDVPYSEKYFT